MSPKKDIKLQKVKWIPVTGDHEITRQSRDKNAPAEPTRIETFFSLKESKNRFVRVPFFRICSEENESFRQGNGELKCYLFLFSILDNADYKHSNVHGTSWHKFRFISFIETFVVGILYKGLRELLPDESQSFLDG